jgi:tetratricopeptide (TPR) repeat protein
MTREQQQGENSYVTRKEINDLEKQVKEDGKFYREELQAFRDTLSRTIKTVRKVPHANRNRYRMLTILIGLLIIALALTTLVRFQQLSPGNFSIIIDSDAQDIATPGIESGQNTIGAVGQRTEDAIETAERAIDYLNTLMTFVQGGAILLTLIAGVLVFAGYRSTERLDEALQQSRDTVADLERLATELKESKDILVNLPARTKASNLILMAQQKTLLNDLQSAASLLEAACKSDPKNQIAQHFLGEVYLRLEEYEDARKWLGRATTNGEDVDFPEACANYAYALRMLADSKEYADKGQQMEKDAKDIMDKLWRNPANRLATDMYGESIFGVMAGLYKSWSERHRKEGDSSKAEEYRQEAIKWYERAFNATPDNTYPLNNIAQLKLISLNPEENKQAQAIFGRIETFYHYRINYSNDYWQHFDYMTAMLGKLPENATVQDVSKVRDRIMGKDTALEKVFNLLYPLDEADTSMIGSPEKLKEPFNKFKKGLNTIKNDGNKKLIEDIEARIKKELGIPENTVQPSSPPPSGASG